MNLYYKLERKFGRYAIPNLNKYMAIIYSLGLFIVSINSTFYWRVFSLNIPELLDGQVYRIFTFVVYPPFISFSLLLSVLGIYIYYNFTTALLYVWRDFKFNLYMLTGMIVYVVVGIIVYFLYGGEYIVILDPSYFAMSIFVAFAFNFPEERLYLMFFLPIRAKYVAVLEILIYSFAYIGASVSTKASIMASLLSVLLFMYFVDKYSFKNFLRSLFSV